MATLNFPDNPSTGDTYSDANSGFEYEWNGTVWISIEAGKRSNIQEIDDISGSFNGSTTDFTLTSTSTPIEPTNAQQVVISLGGVLQNVNDDYTIDGSTITFTTAPADGLTFFGTYLNTYLSSTTVADNTVSTGSLSASSNYTVGGVNVTGVSTLSGLTFTGISSIAALSSSNLAVSGIGTIGNVIHTKDASGLGATMGAAVGIVTYFGDASNLTGVGMTLFTYSSDPADGSTSQGATTNIVTTWSSPIQAGTGTITIRTGSASGTIVDQFVVGSSSSITFATSELTLNPAITLDYDTTFYVVYPAGSIESAGGQNSNQEIITSFATEPQPRYLYTSGWNHYGTLGQNDRTNRSSPVLIGTSNTWQRGFRSQGNNGQFLLTKTDGTLWSWGYNSNGQLGLNDVARRSSPVQLPGTTWGSSTFSNGVSMSSVTGIIKTDGTLWVWGNNTVGELGLNDAIQRSSPTQIGTDTDWSVPTSEETYSISQNRSGFIALKTNGTLWSWGQNQSGELGLNTNASPSNHGISSPTQVGTDTTWKAVGFSRALKTDGTLWTWGRNTSGGLGLNQAGTPGTDQNFNAISSPTQIPGDWGDANLMGASESRNFIVKGDGTMWVWGSNGYTGRGVLGLNDGDVQYSSPVQMPGTTWKTAVSGGDESFAFKTDGTMWTWGQNKYGAQANPGWAYDSIRSSPTQIGGTNWVHMASAYLTSALIKSSTS
tara:strand:- start:73 stop:2214 length:2142 start_codon:yes stop_codon:yes gene_type:complete